MDSIYTVIIEEKLEDYCNDINITTLYNNYYRNEYTHDVLSFNSKEQLLKYINEFKNKKTVESKLYNEDYKDFIRQLIEDTSTRSNGVYKSIDELWKNIGFHHKAFNYILCREYDSDIDKMHNSLLCIVCADLNGTYKLNYPTPNVNDKNRAIRHLLLIDIYKNDLVYNDTDRVEHQLVKNLEEN